MNSVQASSIPKKQPISVRKAEANRNNALKSTGPRSPKGKANSRMNAVKHGLFIQGFKDFALYGDAEDLLALHRRLWEELKPAGPREEAEVEYICVNWLRLRRLWRFENAEIVAGILEVQRDVRSNRYQTPERVKAAEDAQQILPHLIVIRYGNAIERQLSRAYARLERLQARRRGESLPPTLNLQMTD